MDDPRRVLFDACVCLCPSLSFTVSLAYHVTLCGLRLASCHRRVVAVGVDPHSTAASEVMTHNPTTVLTEDSAMEALGIMLGRHFRHLPVRGID